MFSFFDDETKTISFAFKSLQSWYEVFVSSSKKENTISYDEINTQINDVEIIINTTPKEMFPNNNQEIISLENFNNLTSVIDVIFNPLRTNLILKAKEKNIKCCSGLYMLIAQAFFAIELFKDVKLDKTVINELYYQMLNEKQNIVLIGMPSCGKSTIAKILGKDLKRKIVDIDKLIEKQINMKISDFFKTHSEEEFRKIESDIIYEVSKKQNVIIATGGGAIINPLNVKYLKQNGIIFFIDRPLEKLIISKSRPLSSTKEKLKQLYDTRYELYLSSCDYKIDGNKSLNSVVNDIKGGIK